MGAVTESLPSNEDLDDCFTEWPPPDGTCGLDDAATGRRWDLDCRKGSLDGEATECLLAVPG
jgi:hypothetical protein